MPLLTGPELDAVAKELQAWYVETRSWLIEQLSSPYPYGSSPLTEDEQLEQYLALTPETWQALIARLEERYRGLKDMRERVQADLSSYVKSMDRLRRKREGVF